MGELSYSIIKVFQKYDSNCSASMILKLLFVLLLFGMNSTVSYGNKVFTKCNGVWNNPAIWVNNLSPTDGDSIFVNHYVAITEDIVLNNNVLINDKYGEICGPYNFTVNAGSIVYNYGKLGAWYFYLNDTVLNYGSFQSTKVLITQYFLTKSGGSVKVDSSFKCFDRIDCTPLVLELPNDTLKSNTSGLEYEWYLNNTKLNTITQSIKIDQQGHYKVRVRDSTSGNFSEFSDSVMVYLDGMHSFKNWDVRIFPNPVSSEITIEFSHATSKPLYCSVFNQFGQLIKLINFNNISQDKINLNIDDLDNGIFYLKLVSRDYQVVKRIIKI